MMRIVSFRFAFLCLLGLLSLVPAGSGRAASGTVTWVLLGGSRAGRKVAGLQLYAQADQDRTIRYVDNVLLWANGLVDQAPDGNDVFRGVFQGQPDRGAELGFGYAVRYELLSPQEQLASDALMHDRAARSLLAQAQFASAGQEAVQGRDELDQLKASLDGSTAAAGPLVTSARQQYQLGALALDRLTSGEPRLHDEHRADQALQQGENLLRRAFLAFPSPLQ
jgi:hypothetical protein